MITRPVQQTDADSIARVHERALPWSINGRLGHSHLKGMYERLLSGPDCVGYVSLHKDEIIAFQVSTTDWEAARKRLAEIDWRSKARVVGTCLLHPYDLFALFEVAFLIPRAFRRTKVKAEIMAWAAEPANPIAVMGAHQCLLSSIAELASRGETKCLGQMQKPNERPMKALSKLSPVIFSKYIRNDVLIFNCTEIAKKAV